MRRIQEKQALGGGPLRQASVYVLWMQEQERLQRQSPAVVPGAKGHATRAFYVNWKQEKTKEWKQVSASPKQLKCKRGRSNALVRRLQTNLDCDGHVDDSKRAVFRTVVDGIASTQCLFAAFTFEAVARDLCNVSEGDPSPGFRRYDLLLREKQLENTFISDQHSIARTEKFKVCVPCPLAHPNLCCETHAWCMGQVHACTKSVLQVLNGEAGNTFWHIRALGVGGYHVSSWFELSSTRFAGPAFWLLRLFTLSGVW